jgi:hypothetical protein
MLVEICLKTERRSKEVVVGLMRKKESIFNEDGKEVYET